MKLQEYVSRRQDKTKRNEREREKEKRKKTTTTITSTMRHESLSMEISNPLK